MVGDDGRWMDGGMDDGIISEANGASGIVKKRCQR